MMLPEPVSAIATSVAGPSGVIPGVGFSVALPDMPVVRLTHVTFSGSLCSAAGPGVPIAVNTYAVWAARGPGFGIGAGPATDIAVAITLPPSDRQPFPIDGYMNSCVGGASGPKAGGGAAGAAGAAAGGAGAEVSGPGAAAAAGASGARAANGVESGAAPGAGASASPGAGPTTWAGSTPGGQSGSGPGTTPAAGTCNAGVAADGGPAGAAEFGAAGNNWFRLPGMVKLLGSLIEKPGVALPGGGGCCTN